MGEKLLYEWDCYSLVSHHVARRVTTYLVLFILRRLLVFLGHTVDIYKSPPAQFSPSFALVTPRHTHTPLRANIYSAQGERSIWRAGGTGSSAPVVAKQWYSTIIYIFNPIFLSACCLAKDFGLDNLSLCLAYLVINLPSAITSQAC